MSVVGLRPATPADGEFVFLVHRATMREHVAAVWGWDDDTQRGFHERAFDPAGTAIITVDGDDAGVLIVVDRASEVYLARIEVGPARQGHGIGTRLIGRLIRDAAAAGKPVVLDVLTVNDRARVLYHRLGFRETGRHGDGDIKIRMRRDPDAAPPPASRPDAPAPRVTR